MIRQLVARGALLSVRELFGVFVKSNAQVTSWAKEGDAVEIWKKVVLPEFVSAAVYAWILCSELSRSTRRIAKDACMNLCAMWRVGAVSCSSSIATGLIRQLQGAVRANGGTRSDAQHPAAASCKYKG